MWNPMTTGFTKATLIYVISMKFLSLSRRRSSSQNVPKRKMSEPEKRLPFAGYTTHGLLKS